MSSTKILVLLLLLISGCAHKPQPQAHDYKPNISLSNVVNFNKALASLEQNQPDKAESLLRKLTDDNSEISGPWLNLGLLYFKKGLFQKSEHAAHNALMLNPRNPYALNLSGMLKRRKGNILDAHSLYTEAVKYKPDYAIAHYNLALLYDIYFQDINTAAKHYINYLNLTGGKDKNTIDWLEQLKSTLNKS